MTLRDAGRRAVLGLLWAAVSCGSEEEPELVEDPATADVGKPDGAVSRAPNAVERQVLELIEKGKHTPVPDSELLPLYEQLEPVSVEFMKSIWHGSYFNGTPQGQAGWYGKDMRDPDDVRPLLYQREDGSVYANEMYGRAALSIASYGTLSPTVLLKYKNTRILDYFRRVTDDTVLGLTPASESQTPEGSDFFFQLTRANSTVITAASASPDAGRVVDAGLDAGLIDPELDAAAEASATSDGGFIPPWMKRADLGEGDGKDVVTIGDSWMAGPLGGAGIQAGLDRAGTDYRHYAVTATTLLSGQIPGQYDRAKRANPKISTVIMTGGGNDVMFTAGSCSTPESCAEFSTKITNALNTLWTKMADDGVKDVIYVQYSENAGSTPAENRGGSAKPAAICYSGRISCHTVPTTDIIARSDLTDGIHPGTAGNNRIAKRVLELMVERKVRR
jgi:lysophospholipase L1-like esterase